MNCLITLSRASCAAYIVVSGFSALTFSKTLNTGKLDFDEFQRLWIDVMSWKVYVVFLQSRYITDRREGHGYDFITKHYER